MKHFRAHWSLLAACAAQGACLLVVLVAALRETGGTLVYALDDPYIHLAIARNFAQNGVWGINSGEFASASSSPLWTLALSVLIRLFGVSDLYPLILNIVLSFALTLSAHVLLTRSGMRGALALLAVLAAFCIARAPALVFSGMEHVLHTLITLWFVVGACHALSARSANPRYAALTIACALLVTAARYEGVFVAAVVVTLLMLRRRIALALAVALAASLPIVLMAMISVANGWYAVPNGVLLKAHPAGGLPTLGLSAFMDAALGSPAYGYTSALPLLLLLIAGAAALLMLRRAVDQHSDMLRVGWAVFISASLLHILFARIGWFYRYEAYLVYGGMVLLVMTLQYALQLRPRALISTAPALVAAIAAIALLPAVWESLRVIPPASRNIHQQQYQMALFLKQHFAGSVVAMNDIGTASFMSDVTIVDLWGLGSMPVAASKLAGVYDTAAIRRITRERGATIALVYDAWFTPRPGLPAELVRVGAWTIRDNVIAGSDTVTFYALDPHGAEQLTRRLQAFSSQLPEDVVVTISP